jgi:hypothetical protein
MAAATLDATAMTWAVPTASPTALVQSSAVLAMQRLLLD